MEEALLYGKDAPAVGATPSVVMVDPKFPHNVGAAVRAASCFGIEQVWFTGDRVSLDPDSGERLPREERMKGYSDVDLFQFDYPLDAFGDGTVPVAVEVRENSENLAHFVHPSNAVYVFGPEDGSLGKATLSLCHRFVIIPTRHCVNLAAAIYIVLYDRAMKMWLAGDEPLPTLREERGFIGESGI